MNKGRVDTLEPDDLMTVSSNDCLRRVSLVASGHRDGLLPDHRAGAQPRRQQLVLMPRRRPKPCGTNCRQCCRSALREERVALLRIMPFAFGEGDVVEVEIAAAGTEALDDTG